MTDDVDTDLGGELDEPQGDDRTAKMLREVRAEAAKRRVLNRELSERAAQLQADLEAERAEAARMKEELEANRDVLEREKKERQAILDEITAANLTVINSLPERLQKLVPTDYTPSKLRGWLDAAVPELTRAVAPMDGQSGSRQDRTNDTLAVDQDAAEFAKAFGLDPQLLVKEMQKKK